MSAMPPEARPTIQTLVFFDLETTGLPDWEFNRTKITELSMIACDVQHLLAAGRRQSTPPTLPRVQHKLSVCLNPFKMIQPQSTQITGLDNFLLEQQQRFSANTARLLGHFLQQLTQPVCLVAHNGSGFDYPLLSRELLRVDMKLPADVWCVDSLSLFRQIDDQDVEEPINAEVTTTPEHSAVADDLQAAIESSKQIDWRRLNETTPKQAAKPEAPANRSETSVPASSKRKLFTAESGTGPSPRKSFRLDAIYERMFDTMPAHSHCAEADTSSLMECVCRVGERFVRLLETEAMLFSEIVPLGK